MAGDIIAARLADRLAPGLGESIAERLLLSPRLGARVRDWALDGADAALASIPADDRDLVAAGEPALRRAVSLAGAVWHANRIRSLVLAKDLQSFIEAHGPAARMAALRHAALAPQQSGDDPLPEAVSADGRACVAAWIDALPPVAAAALRLTLPVDLEAPPGDAHRAHGPAIVQAVAPETLVEPAPAEEPP